MTVAEISFHYIPRGRVVKLYINVHYSATRETRLGAMGFRYQRPGLGPPVGFLQLLDIEFFHFQNGLHDSIRPGRIGIAQHLADDRSDDLPREPVLVLQPSTLHLLTALGELLPHTVQLVLRLAVHHERNRFGELEHRPAVERKEL